MVSKHVQHQFPPYPPWTHIHHTVQSQYTVACQSLKPSIIMYMYVNMKTSHWFTNNWCFLCSKCGKYQIIFLSKRFGFGIPSYKMYDIFWRLLSFFRQDMWNGWRIQFGWLHCRLQKISVVDGRGLRFWWGIGVEKTWWNCLNICAFLVF